MKQIIAMKDNIYINSLIDVRARFYGLMAVHFFFLDLYAFYRNAFIVI